VRWFLSYISPNEEWDYCGEAKDGSGNTWYAIKKRRQNWMGERLFIKIGNG